MISCLTSNEKLEQIPFPLKFSVLINPGFDISKLNEVGYSSSERYILGQSKLDKKHIGWAGLTEDGSKVGNVSGKFTDSTILGREGALFF